MKKFKNLIRSFKDYIYEYENVHRSFMLPKKEIKIPKQNKSTSKLEKKIRFKENLFKRLRLNFLDEIYAAGGHWEDIYKELKLNSLIKELNEKDNKFFYEIISKPHESDIHYGFSDITKSYISSHRYLDFYNHETIYDCIFRIACSLGIVRLPEVYHKNNNKNFSSEELIDKIFENLGVKSDFKNTYSMEKGIKTKYGIISYAPIQQLYHAIKVLEITKDIKNPKVLEIGAGIGCSAYHAWNFGIKDYSIVDLPLGCISIGFNLSNLIGEDNLLFGIEAENQIEIEKKIKILTSNNLEITKNFDLIINCDSITEMSKQQADEYVNFASKKAKFFLSINHEGNSFTVDQIFSKSSFDKISRNLTWYRQGYVEELFKNKNF